MKKPFLFFCFLIIASQNVIAQQGITFSEIMFAPESGPNEFIEVYNPNDVAIDLTDYQVKYYTANNDHFISTGSGYFIKPHSFAVIFENDYDLTNGIYKNIVPPDALILKISDNSFGSNGMSNSSDRTLVLFNNSGDTVDTYTYSANNKIGYSDEKIRLINDNSAENWNNSISLNGTPGSQNSVTPLNYDLAITKFSSKNKYIAFGNEAQVQVTVKNQGIKNSNDFQLNLFIDSNKDSIAENTEILNSYQNGLLSPGDSIIYNISISNFVLGDNILIAKIETSEDENPANNFAYYDLIGIYVNEQRGDIVINEIMYAPESPEPEWIEIYNNSSKSINLWKYRIADNSDTLSVINGSLIFNPGEFCVISSDSSIKDFYSVGSNLIYANLPTLNNSGDKVILLDSLNLVIDSLLYYPEWGGINGWSLERISYNNSSTDSTNWRSSLNEKKATPGDENSVISLIGYKPYSIIINEIMSDPDPSGCEFIELYNISTNTVNLGGWTINDKSGNSIPVSNFNRYLYNNSYFLVAADSSAIKNYSINDLSNANIINTSSLSLAANEDIIILKDALKNTIDSVHYYENWHNPNFIITKGKSLEKINPYLSGNDPNNWSTSANPDGATPGRQNSIYTTTSNTESKVSVSPNPFSPDNDGYEDFTIIHYKLTRKIAQVRIKIFDSRGRLIRTLENNLASGNEGSIIFDGLDDNKQPLRIGIYIALIEAINQNNGSVEKMKAAIVVAKKF